MCPKIEFSPKAPVNTPLKCFNRSGWRDNKFGCTAMTPLSDIVLAVGTVSHRGASLATEGDVPGDLGTKRQPAEGSVALPSSMLDEVVGRCQ